MLRKHRFFLRRRETNVSRRTFRLTLLERMIVIACAVSTFAERLGDHYTIGVRNADIMYGLFALKPPGGMMTTSALTLINSGGDFSRSAHQYGVMTTFALSTPRTVW